MKKLCFLTALFLFGTALSLVAQNVGINNDGSAPHPSAGLDVKYADKGLLIPRVALVQTSSAAPVTSPAISLLVYNTETINDVSPGYYFWSGTAWIRLSAFNGTSGTTNFVTKWAAAGTLGNSQLFDDGTNVGIGTVTPGAKLDVAGTVKIADGTQGADKVLTSDANGLANWQNSELTELASTPSPAGCYQLTGTATTGYYPNSVAVSGNYAYVANSGSNTMTIYDISDPANPDSVGSVNTGIWPISVAVSENYAYVANLHSHTMTIYNVSLPASPDSVGSVGTGTYPNSVAVSGNYAYVANPGSHTMTIYDVSVPASIVQVGFVFTGENSSPGYVAVSGDYAYLANALSNTMTIYNVSNPASPVLIGSVNIGAHSMSLVVSGNYAYMANPFYDTMTIYNVSDPASPYEVGSVSTGLNSDPVSVAVSGNYAYVGNSNNNTMIIYNVSNPANPSQVGAVNTGLWPYSIAVSGDYAYVANEGSHNMQIFQLSCPQNILLQNGNVVLAPAIWSTSNNNIYNANPGNVGIGTTSPAKKLDVTGEMQTTGTGDNYFAGNVGIGTTSPGAKLHLNEGIFLITGTYGSGDNIPASGGGTKMFFYPKKSAFRAGYESGSVWDEANIGYFSTAFGQSTIATGYTSTAFGSSTTANGMVSTAFGSSTTASGYNSTAMGYYTSAKSGYETVIGRWNSDYTPASTVDWDANDRLFSIGNGTASNNLSDAMTVLKNGNVGIGTSSPSSKLDVNGNIGLHDGALFLRSGGSDVNHGMLWSGVVDGPEFRGAAGFVWKNGTAGTTELMRLTSTGLGIGTTSPSEKLDVNGTIKAQDFKARDEIGFRFFDNNSNGYLQINNAGGTWISSYASEGNLSPISFSSNVGIGTSSPSEKLDVAGNIKAKFALTLEREGSSAQKAFIKHQSDDKLYVFNDNTGNTGVVLNEGANTWSSTSDARLKKNIEPVTGILNNVCELSVRRYHYKTDPDTMKKRLGFIAQDVQRLFPELVNTDAEYLSLSYTDFGVLSIEAIKELRAEKDAEIARLSKENAELNKKLESMQAQIEVIKGYLEVSAVK